MSDTLFDLTSYTRQSSSFTDYDLDLQGDDPLPIVYRTGKNTKSSRGFKEIPTDVVVESEQDAKSSRGLICSKPADCLTVSADLEKPLELPEESLSPNLSKLTQMHGQCCNITPQTSPFTTTSKITTPGAGNSICTPLDSLVPEPVTLDCERDYFTQNQPSGLKPCAVSVKEDPSLSLLKTLKDLSITDFEQCLEDSEWQGICGTIRSSYRQRNSERRTKETDCSSLPTPTTYPKGSGKHRPAGQNKLESSLRKHIQKGDKLNSQVVGWMMGFRPGYVESVLMDGGLNIQLPFIPEFVTTPQNDEKPAIFTLDPSVQNKPRSLSVESSISIPLPNPLELNEKRSLIDEPQANPLELNPLELSEKRSLIDEPQANPLELNPLELSEKRSLIDEPQANPLELNSFPVLGENLNPLEPNTNLVLGETTKPRASGWLENYTKNKKLKGGIIATYPRCEGDRNPDNPDHWYWAYRWEEKRQDAKSDNGYVTRAVSLSKDKVQAVNLAIALHWSVEKILSFIRGELTD